MRNKQLYIVFLEDGGPHAFYGDEEARERLGAGQDVREVSSTRRVSRIDLALRLMEDTL